MTSHTSALLATKRAVEAQDRMAGFTDRQSSRTIIVFVQPPASLKVLGDPIYEAFYGLKEQPFAITTDPRFFYLSASHQRAFSELLNGLRRHESMLLLTGETGTGKTTLCRAVLQTLGERTFSALVLNPYMSSAEVLRLVLRDFGLVSHEDLRRGALATADVPQLLDALEGFLQSLIPLGSHAVIVMDEAQSLAPGILDHIRLLTGLEYQGHRLVQVVLCGQPGLLTTLKAEPLKALNERITRRVELSPLPGEEIRRYIEHRLAVAGGTETVRFDEAATHAIADLSRGLPRRVNVLCDRALQEGRIEGANVITTDLVKRAARALAGVHDPTPVAPPEPVMVGAPAGEATAAPAAAETHETVELPGLMFGQELAVAPKMRRRTVILIAAAVIVAGALAYFFYAWPVLPPAAEVPSVVPPGPGLDGGGAPAPLPVRPEEQLQQTAPAAEPAAPAAAPVTPAPSAAPPAAAPAPRPESPTPAPQAPTDSEHATGGPAAGARPHPVRIGHVRIPRHESACGFFTGFGRHGLHAGREYDARSDRSDAGGAVRLGRTSSRRLGLELIHGSTWHTSPPRVTYGRRFGEVEG